MEIKAELTDVTINYMHTRKVTSRDNYFIVYGTWIGRGLSRVGWIEKQFNKEDFLNDLKEKNIDFLYSHHESFKNKEEYLKAKNDTSKLTN